MKFCGAAKSILPYEVTKSATIWAGVESEHAISRLPLPDLAIMLFVVICRQVIRPYEVDRLVVSAEDSVTLMLPLPECNLIDLPLSSSDTIEP